jgi:hypothetical protein
VESDNKKNDEETKKNTRRLLLRRETLRKLNDRALTKVNGGGSSLPTEDTDVSDMSTSHK